MSDASVLIVEDDPHLREALFDTLTAESVSVLTADSGPAALDILSSEPVGLVISDLQMEPMDGATLLKNIHERHPRLPAILMTAYGTIENAVDVILDQLPKSVLFQALCDFFCDHVSITWKPFEYLARDPAFAESF